MSNMEPQNNEELFNNYISWIGMLRCPVSTGLDPPSLVACLGLAEILHRIDDEGFPEEWVEKFYLVDSELEEDGKQTKSKWRLKGRHLERMLTSIFAYLREHAKYDLKDHPVWKIDQHLFAEFADLNELNKVLNLVVASAMLGRNKQEFIDKALQQDVTIQHLTMNAVRNVTENSNKVEEVFRNLVSSSEVFSNCSASSNGNGSVDQTDRINQLSKENDELRLCKARQDVELDELKQTVHTLKLLPVVDDLRNEIEDLKTRKERTEEILMDTEGKMDVLNATLERKDLELDQIRTKMSQLDVFETNYNGMKDELEELRLKEANHLKVARELEQYKEKAKDASSDKNELLVLREKCERYLADTVKLKDEEHKTKSLRQQIGALKAQLDEKEDKVNKLTIRLDKVEAELGESKSNLIVAEKKIEIYVNEKLELQDKITEQFLPRDASKILLNDMGTTSDNDSSSDEKRARHLDQERELSRLRERVRELEGLEDERREWQTTKGRIRELESQVQIAAAKKLELETSLEHLEKQLETHNSNDGSDVVNLQLDMERMSIEIDKVRKGSEMLERHNLQLNLEKQSLEATIGDKDKSLVEAGERLKKAKQLLGGMEERMTSSEEAGMSMHQFDSLRKEIEKKDAMLKTLEDKLLAANTSLEEENRLMTSGMHEMIRKHTSSPLNTSGSDSRSSMARQKAASASVNSISAWWFPWSLVVILCIAWGMSIYTKDLVRSAPALV